MTIDTRPSKAGAKPKEPPADAAKRIQRYTSRGFDIVGVSIGLDCSVTVLRRWMDEHPELKEAFDRGREKERQALHGKLFAQAMKGNIVANLFLLKARHGYVEGAPPDAGNQVRIVFNLPAPTPLADFKVIEHGHPTDRSERLPGPGAAPARRS